MNQPTIHLLIVEDNNEYAAVLKMILNRESPGRFEITRVAQLTQALDQLREENYELILLDLSLPDSGGLYTFSAVRDQAADVPIVVLSAVDDKELAMHAVRQGAQDFLLKGVMEPKTLVRSLEYAVERHETMERLQHLSMFDELTGLLNRRGFLSLAKRHLKLAERSGKRLLLFFGDMNGLKKINDRYGHQDGDQALIAIADILRKTFRSSDIIARLGGDEFTILAIDTDRHARAMLDRIQLNVDRHNALKNKPYDVSISFGVAEFNPKNKVTLEELLHRADQALYEKKRRSQSS